MNSLITLKNIFRDVFDDDTLNISETTSQSDIEDWDSVAQVKLVLTIESEFEIRFSTEEVSTLKSVGDFLQAIAKHKGE